MTSLTPLQIGPVTIPIPIILAPMSGVTDLPFRRLVKKYGVDLVISEMIASEAMIRETKRSMKMTTSCAEEFPMAVQLAGCDPNVMAEAAKLNVDRGAVIIDINMGCPVKKVVNGYAGSALMKDELHAAKILEATVRAVDVPVTLKMRTGWDAEHRNAPHLAKIAQECGIQMITIHGRTRAQLYNGVADCAFIGEVKKAINIPVIANGDIRTFEDAKKALHLSNADGLMIGRGTYGRPWFLAQLQSLFKGDPAPAEPQLGQKLALIQEHVGEMVAHYGEITGIRMARKHLGWYSKGLPQSTDFRVAINRTQTFKQIQDLLEKFFSPLLHNESTRNLS